MYLYILSTGFHVYFSIIIVRTPIRQPKALAYFRAENILDNYIVCTRHLFITGHITLHRFPSIFLPFVWDAIEFWCVKIFHILSMWCIIFNTINRHDIRRIFMIAYKSINFGRNSYHSNVSILNLTKQFFHNVDDPNIITKNAERDEKNSLQRFVVSA